jgi:CheY-like chemotaxis protein
MPSKILVIDDNLGASRIAEGVLSQHFNGGDVLVAQRAVDAFERFSIAQPDLILLSDSLPDLDAESICYRLLNEPSTASVPIALMATNGKSAGIEQRFSNVVRTLPKPVTPELLQEVFSTTLPKTTSHISPARSMLFYDPARSVFSGHTGFFSLRSALQMAYTDRMSGVLRFFLNRVPIEVYVIKGKFIFAATSSSTATSRRRSSPARTSARSSKVSRTSR